MNLENRFTLTKEAREFRPKKTEVSKMRGPKRRCSFRCAHGVVSVDKGENTPR
jgi:hypothetical protein